MNNIGLDLVDPSTAIGLIGSATNEIQPEFGHLELETLFQRLYLVDRHFDRVNHQRLLDA